MQLGRVMLFVKDLPKMSSFYRDAIGLELVEAREGWIALDAGGSTFVLHEIPSAIAKDIAIETPPRRRSETPYKLTFVVDDVARIAGLVPAFGGVAGEVKRSGEAVSCEVLDPEGNVFVVYA
jgi:catechol-2,3-dioxygenase